MKKGIFLCLCLLVTSSAYAADAPRSGVKFTCGETIEQCQKKVDDLTAQVLQLTINVEDIRVQRDVADQEAANSEKANLQQKGK